MQFPQILQVMNDDDFVLKPHVNGGSPWIEETTTDGQNFWVAVDGCPKNQLGFCWYFVGIPFFISAATCVKIDDSVVSFNQKYPIYSNPIISTILHFGFG